MNKKLYSKHGLQNTVQNGRNEKWKEILTPPCLPKASAA